MTKLENAEIVEMDAMDVNEWEGEQLTPQASDAKLAALVKQTSAAPVAQPPARAPSTVTRTATVPAKRPTITIPTVAPPRPRATAATPAPLPVVAPPVPAPRALVLPLPAVVVPPVASIVIEADEPPPEPPRRASPTPPAPVAIVAPPVIAQPEASTIIVEPAPTQSAADASGGGPYSLPVLQPVPEPERELAPRIAAPPPSRRTLALVGGAIACFVTVVAVLSSGGHHASTPAPIASAPTPAPTAAAATIPTPTPTPTPPPVTAPTEPTPPPAPVKPAPPRIASNAYFANKKLVLDYDKQPPPPKLDTSKPDDEALAKARAAYAIGNQRLFAGDPDGAVRAYHQALTVFPGYVAGYRGLGLAFAQLGDKASALGAFRIYISLVPTAKDVALIKKRIAALES